MFIASFPTACEYGHDDPSSEYAQFDAHEGDSNVTQPVSLMEEASYVGLSRLITLCRTETVLSLLELKEVPRQTAVMILEMCYVSRLQV